MIHMIQMICFFAPSLLAARLYEKKERKHFTVKEFVVAYASFVGIINMLCHGAVAVLLHHPDYVLNTNMISIGFSFKYLLLGYILAVVLPTTYSVIKECIRIELVVQVENEDENNSNDK